MHCTPPQVDRTDGGAVLKIEVIQGSAHPARGSELRLTVLITSVTASPNSRLTVAFPQQNFAPFLRYLPTTVTTSSPDASIVVGKSQTESQPNQPAFLHTHTSIGVVVIVLL